MGKQQQQSFWRITLGKQQQSFWSIVAGWSLMGWSPVSPVDPLLLLRFNNRSPPAAGTPRKFQPCSTVLQPLSSCPRLLMMFSSTSLLLDRPSPPVPWENSSRAFGELPWENSSRAFGESLLAGRRWAGLLCLRLNRLVSAGPHNALLSSLGIPYRGLVWGGGACGGSNPPPRVKKSAKCFSR
jgi:hypothetical protein